MQQRIRDEQLQLLFAGLPSSLLATLVLLILTVTVSQLTGAGDVTVACGSILLVTVARFVLWWAYRHHAQPENIAWSSLFFIGCVAAGAAWGLAGVLVFPGGDIAAQSFLAFVIGGVSAGAVTTLAVEKRNVLAFVLPCVLPLSIRFIYAAHRASR